MDIMKKSINAGFGFYLNKYQLFNIMKFLLTIAIFITSLFQFANGQDIKLQFQENLSFNAKGLELHPNGRELLLFSEFDIINYHIPTRKILFKRGVKGRRIHSANYLGNNIYIETGYYETGSFSPDSIFLINKFNGEIQSISSPQYRIVVNNLIDKDENWLTPFWSIYSEKYNLDNPNHSICGHTEIGFSKDWNNWKSQTLKVEDGSCILRYKAHPTENYLALASNKGKIYVIDSTFKILLETEAIDYSIKILKLQFIKDELFFLYEDLDKGIILDSYNYKSSKKNFSKKLDIDDKLIPAYKFDFDLNHKNLVYSDFEGCKLIGLENGKVESTRRTNSVNGPMVFDSKRNGVFIFDAYKSNRSLIFIQLDFLNINKNLFYPKVEFPYNNISFNKKGELVLDFVDVKIFGNDFLKPNYFRIPESDYNLVGVNYQSTIYDKSSELFFSVEGNSISQFDVDTLFIRSYDQFGKKKDYFSLKVKKNEFNSFQFFAAYLNEPKLIVLKDNEFQLFFYDLKGKLIKKLKVEDVISSLNHIYFSPNGKYFSYVNEKYEVEILELPGFKSVHKSKTNSRFNFTVNFYSDEYAAVLHNEGDENPEGSIIYFVELEEKSSEKSIQKYFLNDIYYNVRSERILIAGLNGDSSLVISTSAKDGSSNVYQFPGYVSKIICSPISDQFITVNNDGSFLIWKEGISNWQLKYFEDDKGNFGWVTHEGYFSGSSGIGEATFFTLYNFICDHNFLDPILNRPDIIQSRWLFSNPEREKLLHESVKKRSKFKFSDPNYITSLNPVKLNNYALLFKPYLTHSLPVVIKDSTNNLAWNLEDSLKQFKPKFKIYQNNIFIKETFDYKTKVYMLNGLNSFRIETEIQGKRLIPLNFKIDASLEYKPNIIYVGIGVSKYRDSSYNLPYAAKDILNLAGIFNCQNNPDACNEFEYLNKAVSRIGKYYQTQEQIDSANNAEKRMDDSMKYYFSLENKQSFNINKINVYTLLNEEVTASNLKKLEKTIKLNSDPRDIIIIHFAGHGMLDSENDFFLAGYDMDFKDPKKNGIPYSQIDDFLKSGPLNRLVFIDACQSGLIDPDFKREIDKVSDTFRISKAWSRGSILLDEPDMVFETAFELMQNHFQVLDMETGASVMAATAGNALAYESPIWNNGVFTFCIIRGLFMREADLDDNYQISISELKSFLQAEVPKLTQGLQRPAMRAENTENDFVIW